MMNKRIQKLYPTNCSICKIKLKRYRPKRIVFCSKCKKEREREKSRIYKKRYYEKYPQKVKASNKKWRENNPDKLKEARRRQNMVAQKRRHEAKETVLKHYGAKCKCCDETTKEFLTIDHIYGGGRQHKRSNGRLRGMGFYRWIVENNFPKNLQLLCMNCNFAKGLYGKCPHLK